MNNDFIKKILRRKVEPVEQINGTINATSDDLTRTLGFRGEQLINSYEQEEVRRDNLKIEDYRRMIDNDGQVQMIWNAITNTILSAGIEIQDDEDVDGAEESEELVFIKNNLTKTLWKGGMSATMELTNATILRALLEGYRIFEVVYRLDKDNKIRIDQLEPRAGDNDRELKILVDNRGRFIGIRQNKTVANQYKDIRIINDSEISKIIKVTYGEEFGSLYGRSAFRAAWYHYDKAHKGMFLNHVGHELGVINPRIITLKGSVTEEQRDAVINAFDRLHIESTILINDSFTVDFPQVTSAEVMREGKEMIYLHYSQMAKSLLLQFVDLGSTTSNTGSRALGDSQTEFFRSGLQNIATILIENTWNKVIADLVKLNFGGDVYPRLVVNPISSRSSDALYLLLETLVKGGGLPDIAKNKVVSNGLSDIGIDISVDELEAEVESQRQAEAEKLTAQTENAKIQEKIATQSRFNKGVEMAEHIHNGDGTEISMDGMIKQMEATRPLYLDEQKVKIADIKRKLDEGRISAEMALSEKLKAQKETILNSFIEALRAGRASIKSTKVELEEQENTYSDELREVAVSMLEFGKRISANELNKSVPNTPKKSQQDVTDYADSIVEEQSARLGLALKTIANDALANNIPENQARLLFEQEYDSFWEKALIPTVALLLSKSLNKGRSVSFDKYQNEIWGYRYTAVLDSHTTDYCRTLDGRVFQKNDPYYALLTPPQHFGCRSFWTPIKTDEAIGLSVDGKPEELPVFASVGSFKDVTDVTELSDKYAKRAEKILLELLDEEKE